MRYFEVLFEIKPYSEAVSDVLAASLADIGFESFEPTPDGLMAYVQQSAYDEHAVSAVVEGVSETFSFALTDDSSLSDGSSVDCPQADNGENGEQDSALTIHFECQEAPDQNWNATWEAEHHFEPIHIAEGIDISIIPRQAFGSGEHATTRMILGLLTARTEDGAPLLPVGGAQVTDAGCGTGVLGIAALKLGAADLFAYDIDEWSVRNSLDNLSLNNLKATVVEGDARVLSTAPKADILLANINRNILLADLPAFADNLKTNGYLILSGFLEDDVKPLVDKALSLGLQLQHHRSDSGWQALLFNKN